MRSFPTTKLSRALVAPAGNNVSRWQSKTRFRRRIAICYPTNKNEACLLSFASATRVCAYFGIEHLSIRAESEEFSLRYKMQDPVVSLSIIGSVL